jgi:phage tail-like protein
VIAVQDTSKFFSLNKPMDWETGLSVNLRVEEKGLSVRQTEKYAVHRIVRTDELSGAEAISDFTTGQGGKLFILDSAANVWTYDYQNKHREALFRQGHQLFSGQSMLASYADVLYIADTKGERRIASYSTSNAQLMWTLQEWNGIELFPLAIAVDTERNFYALVPLDLMTGTDGNPEVPPNGNLGILKWNAGGEAIQLYEHVALRLEAGEEAAGVPLAELLERFFLTASPEGKVAMHDSGRNTVLVFHEDGHLEKEFSIIPAGDYAGISMDSNHHIFIGDRADSEAGSVEHFILQFGDLGESLGKIAGFRGRADKLLHDQRNRMYVLNRMTGEITLLDLQIRTMILEETNLPEAIYFSAELDTMEDETQWHKIGLDADIPEETQVRVSYFALDRKEGFVGERYVDDFSTYLTDASIPLREKLRATSSLWSEPIVNPKDALLMNAKGRYLWFKLEVVGSEHHSPFIRKLRVYFPRISLISYLPPIYQETQEDNSFLERFLALFGTFFQDMEEQIDQISSHFDPDAVSGSFLKWLGGWLAVSQGDTWEEDKLRTLIKEAPELYKQRGTRQGLARMLRIYTGVDAILIEYFQFKQMQETSELRELFADLYGDNPYCFCVMLPPEYVRTDKQRLIIEQIIEDQKPAFTDGKLVVLQPWMYADMHTYIGINTYMSEPTLLTLDQRSSMPYNTVLIDVDRDNRMDIHTRLELDSDLD